MENRTHEEKLKLATEWVEYLNKIAAIDVSLIEKLVEYRVGSLRHADIEKIAFTTEEGGGAVVLGLLGIINGFIGTRESDDRGYVCGVYTDDLKLTHFDITPIAEAAKVEEPLS